MSARSEILPLRHWPFFTLLALWIGLVPLTPATAAALLNDWCLNLNGDTTLACNPAASLPDSVDGHAFDFTVNDPPGTANTLGSLSITVAPGQNQSFIAYFDYDLNFASGSFQDVGSVHGAPLTGQSYELDDPSGAIFGDFAAGSLTDTNNVANGGSSPNLCCDVAWALGMSGINVATGSSETLRFTVTSVKQTSGFYLQQLNLIDDESIYLTESLTVSAVPEPSVIVLGLTGLGFVFIALTRKARHPGRGRMSATR